MIPIVWVGVLCAVGAALTPLVRTAPQSTGSYNGVIRSPFQAAGSYGLAFVAPASYGYSQDGPYSSSSQGGNYAAGFGFRGPSAANLGPGKYAFPIFDHNQGYGGFGALGYYGANLGFAYPGYGQGNGIFGAGAYTNPHV